MKKVILLSCALCLVPWLLAYTSDDVIIANMLADADIIVSHKNNPDAYRIDSAVARQEVIGMTLKLRGVALPLNYDCQGYFSDATFSKDHTDSWVCRAVELAADRWLITRENSTTRPRDNITKAEALAMIWKGAGMDISPSEEGDGTFYDANNKVAVEWQENLLQTARKMGIISPAKDGDKWLWKHNTPATRKEVFAIIATFQTLKNAGKQIPYLTFSGEVQYNPGKTKLISTDPILVQKMKEKDFDSVRELLSPATIQTRGEWSVLYTLEKVPERWGYVQFSSVALLGDKIIQQYSTYNPYSEAIKSMLKRFNLSSEAEFYALPYGLLWEQTRDYVEKYFIDLLFRAKIIYPEGSPIIP
jgi:hypothetical protein